MATCPSGHDSSAADYCDVCGVRISSAPEPAAPPAGSETMVIAAQGEERCPDCDAPRTGRFCETDGYDFLTGAASPARPLPESAGPAGRSTAPGPWTAVIAADRAYYDQVIEQTPSDAEASIEFPSDCPDRVLPLTGGEVRIGRKSMSRGLVPEIDLSGPPMDPGVSHVHAVLAPRGDDDWVLIDAGSTNGTTINGSEQPVPANAEVPVSDGDRIHVGAWTTITLRKTVS
ncbi:FHA domain-containing protein [Actinomadura sp. HBU206391]|uniref:FHA domain-containing protein n=1 Tax=Actinomadura sp. HBU206391 TaxID=2731692 RepID=UPI00164F881A|nr:FHA domain-containing protein [Actinomadura sp. HBU206391]MBC6460811.1 FHA domain-containing protein [Actinomadura sp. HBU206391]